MQSGISKLTALGATLISTVGAANAFPPFKDKEKVPACSYCHMEANGGKRNYRGLFYKANKLSFAAFDDAAEAKKAGVEVGPFPDAKPASWTAPEKTAPEATPAPTPTPAAARPKVNIPVLKAKVAEWFAKYKKSPKTTAKGYAQALRESRPRPDARPGRPARDALSDRAGDASKRAEGRSYQQAGEGRHQADRGRLQGARPTDPQVISAIEKMRGRRASRSLARWFFSLRRRGRRLRPIRLRRREGRRPVR